MVVLCNVFGDQILRRTLWPASSHNLNHCVYYLWGCLQETRVRIIHTHTHTHTQGRANTHTPDEFEKVIGAVVWAVYVINLCTFYDMHIMVGETS